MTIRPTLPAYVVITPVRDEAIFIEQTIASVLSQTHPPAFWVVVDDGSTDQTPQILRRLLEHVSWVKLLRTTSSQRKLGSAEVAAFTLGTESLPSKLAYDFIVKLDADLELPKDYFERLLSRMTIESQWGIASGVYCELQRGTWIPIDMPDYHAAGACKVVRHACFVDIGGFVASKGWDTVDEIRAEMHGWKTGHFNDIQFKHLKPEGAAMGRLATHRFHGEIYHQTGGGLAFLFAKALHRAVRADPRLFGGLAMAWGYIAAAATRRNRLVTDEEASHYRRMLNRRWLQPLRRARALLWR
jgi:poly-beta-1,6-N-acetyl-D-glucosamine synthase